MRITRGMKFATMVCVGVLALSACSEPDEGSSSSSSIDCAPGTLSGEGSSFQNNAIQEWAKNFQQACPEATINYNPTGSGAGIKQFNAGQVDWGGSDSELKQAEADAALQRCGNPAWHLPMVSGAITISYNVAGVDSLVLTPDVAAQIFKGAITKWNDPAIAAENSGASLPDAPITVFFRSDESGTTDNFTRWLHAAAPSVWTQDSSKAWTGIGEGKEKNSGLLDAVLNNANSIAYIDYSDALIGGTSFAKIDLGSGPVELTPDTASAAIGLAEVVGEGNDLILQLDYSTTEAGVYPVVAVAYEIVCSAGLDAQSAALLKAFLTYTSSADGQDVLGRIGYIPLPDNTESQVAEAVAALA